MNSHTMRDEITLPCRLMTLMLLLILGMELTEPLIAHSQVQSPPPSTGTAQTPEVSQDTPPNQEAESIEEGSRSIKHGGFGRWSDWLW
jgi:hypothetical protein